MSLIVGFLVALIMKYPILSVLNVPQADFVESLSIPVQQIARLVREGVPFTDEEKDMLSEIMDLSTVGKEYTPHISDPVKNNIRRRNKGVLESRKMDYLFLWIHFGVKYPTLYIEAWIDQTKGYWNGGYLYWIWADRIDENDLGISLSSDNIEDSIIKQWKNGLNIPNVYTPFVSIGFHVWIYISLFIFSLYKKSNAYVLPVINLSIILTLLLATPVSAEFRYAYSVFISLPITIYGTFIGVNKVSEL